MARSPSTPSLTRSSSGDSSSTSSASYSPPALLSPSSAQSVSDPERHSPPLPTLSSTPAKGKKDAQKPKMRRNGRMILALREDLAAKSVQRTPPISPSSPGSRLASVELRDALSIHLVNQATGEVITLSKPPRIDLSATLANLRVRGLHVRGVDRYQEVLLACLAAMGARRSRHTGIIGSPASTEVASSLDVGQRREAACQVLAKRAISLAQDLNVLREVSPRALEVTNLLRAMLFSVVPRDPFSVELVRYGRLHSFNIASFAPSIGPALISHSTFSLIMYDAYTAIALQRPLEISDFELAKMGLGEDLRIGALPARHPESSEHSGQQLSGMSPPIALARAVVQHQSRRFITDPDDIQPSFRKLFDLADANIAFVMTFHTSSRAASVGFAVEAGVFTLPMVVESTIAKLAAQQCRGRSDSDARELLAAAQRRYLSLLKFFLVLLEPLSPSAADLHNLAFLLDVLEYLPGWLDIALDGATQFESGAGALYPVGFGWPDLLRLLRLLTRVRSIFASCDRRRNELEQALETLEVFVDTTSSSPHETSTNTVRLAADLVANVLKDLSR